jgi:hypothetical protein
MIVIDIYFASLFEYTYWSSGLHGTCLGNIGLNYQDSETETLFKMLH